MYSVQISTCLLRNLNPNVTRARSKNALVRGHCRFYSKFGGYGKRIGAWFSERNQAQLFRSCIKQFEFVAAQRIRRTVQLFHLYSKLWEERALGESMKSWRRRLGRNTKEFLASAVGVTVYNWDEEKISSRELNGYSKEIEGIYKLRDSTVVCKKCHQRLVIDAAQPGIQYCTCNGTKPTFVSINRENDWQPFIERKDMLVWRKEEPDSGGLYAYKVFGSFSDVSAEDFLKVQVDVEYRKEWDPTAKRLEIIDSDPRSEADLNRQSDVVYWEMAWPRLFSNRDYVYERHWVIDKERGIVLIVSKGTDHPDAPIRPDTYRVTTYWSYMVIRPCTEFGEPGIEFGLTYFDDPGVNIPSAVTTWVAMSGLPDFLCRMREAARDYKKYVSSKESDITSTEETNESDEEVDHPINITILEMNEGDAMEEKSEVDRKTIEDIVDNGEKRENQEVKPKTEVIDFEVESTPVIENKSEPEHGDLNSNGENVPTTSIQSGNYVLQSETEEIA